LNSGSTLDDLRPLRLLVAVDGSAGSLSALNRAAQLSKEVPASEVVVIYVLEQGTSGTLTIEEDPDAERRAGSILEDATIFMRNEGVEVTAAILRGPAPAKILEYADGFRPNMILVGSKGMGHNRSDAVGSVADAVSRRSRWPVLVVRS
jgi:nucleotide-binding universal stress UspA family protein